MEDNNTLLADFFKGKNEHSISLFDYLIEQYKTLGDVKLHPTKTMIAIKIQSSTHYIIRIGKDSIDVVFPFKKAYNDNLCFHKIALVPGQKQYNHHFRMYNNEDVNEEVLSFMCLVEGL